MKTTRFLFTIIGIGALAPALSLGENQAGPSTPAEQHRKTTNDHSAAEILGAQSREKSVRVRGRQVQHARPNSNERRAVIDQRRSVAVVNPDTIHLSVPAGDVTDPLPTTKARPQTGPLTLLAHSYAGHPVKAVNRGLPGGLAIIGGPTIPVAKNGAVINGTGMKHRPQ